VHRSAITRREGFMGLICPATTVTSIPRSPAVQQSRRAKVEAVQWFGGRRSSGRLHGDGHLWCTRMDQQDFAACRDSHDYASPQQARQAG